MVTSTFSVFMKLLHVSLTIGTLRSFVQTAKVIEVNKAISRSTLGLRYANFKKNTFTYLNISCLGTDLLQSPSDCGFACLRIPSCFSYNLAAFPDINGKCLCELLPSDMYNMSQKLVRSESHHHFSLESPCSFGPCKNNGTCVSLYEENSYVCVCEERFTGKNCETSCPEGWVPYNVSCYNIRGAPSKNVNDARNKCKDLGADLPVIYSDAENNFMKLLMKKMDIGWAWLGLLRNLTDNSKFYWVDGTPIEGNYDAWKPGEPSNKNTICAYAQGRDGKWNDFPCQHQTGPSVLCQKAI